jgi:phosphate transport system permease protein
MAMPGILTGTILALSRAVGETAPLLMVGAVGFIAFTPKGPGDPFTVLPLQIYNWISRPQSEFHEIAAAGILVLLALLLTMNAAAILLRNRFQARS